MSIKIPKPKVQLQIEPGSYMARCYSMIHIGTTEFEYMGQTKTSNKVRITFELPTETKVFKEGEQAKPLVISAEFALSLHKKSNLRPVLEGWRGKAFTDDEAENFELSKLVGVPAFVNIIHNEKGYAEIASISKMPKGMECPVQVNESQLLDYETFNEELFEKLPDFLKDKIKSSVEYKTLKGLLTPAQMADPSEDPNYPKEQSGEIPF